MKKNILIYINLFLSISAIIFGMYTLKQEDEIEISNNIVQLTDNINELSLIYINTLNEKNIDFIEYISNPDEINYKRYQLAIEKEKKVSDNLKLKDNSMKELESRGYSFLEHEHSNIELVNIEEINKQLIEKENTILKKFDQDLKTNNSNDQNKIKYITEINDIYGILDIEDNVQTFINDHKQINTNVINHENVKRQELKIFITILITLFCIGSLISILQLRKLK